MNRTLDIPRPAARAENAAFGILLALSFSHLLNDSIQALIPALYPLLKQSFGLTFTQIGLITLTFQLTGSLFQPLVGLYTDRHPKPFSLAIGMSITLTGLVLLAFAPRYELVLLAAGAIGLGSAIFHPESSRMARLASGGRHGLAQSLFQVGGNFGTALGPLLAAWIVMPRGQRYVLTFTVVAFCGIFVLARLGKWYAGYLQTHHARSPASKALAGPFGKGKIVWSMAVLLLLMFSKFFYQAAMTNYYTFYLMHKFGLTAQAAQYCLFLFLFSVAAGTIVGGILGDRFGRKKVIWFSILGMSPFALVFPHVGLFWTTFLSVPIGFILASAFPAIVVYATELLPGKVGLVAGTFFGLAFGLAGIGSAILGKLADATSVAFVMLVCGFLPLLGLLTGLLPNLPHETAGSKRQRSQKAAG